MIIRKLRTYMTSRYILVSVIFAVLSTALFLSHRGFSDAIQTTDSHYSRLSRFNISLLEINNKIEVYANETKKNDLLFDEIKSSIDTVINLQQYLSNQEDVLWEINDINEKKKTGEILASLKIYLDSYLKDLRLFIAQSGNPNLLIKIIPVSGEVNKQLNILSDYLVQKKQSDFEFYQRTNILIWLGSLIVLHLVTMFVFRPISKRVEKNTRQLAEEKNVAVYAANAKSDYLATLSHEIRTPLNGVLGLTSLLLDTKLSKEQREYLEMVYDSGENLLFVVNDVFDFSKIESGNLEIEEMYFSIHSCIENIVEEYLPKAKEKNLELLSFIEPDIPSFLLGDSYRLRQCLSNLVNNAIKFTREGEIFIRVNLLGVNDNIYEIQFSVSDTGIGIPEAKQESIFTPGFKLDAPVAKKFHGTGLGMAISSRLVEMMNGRIWLESEVSKGSTFYIAINFKGKEISEKESLREDFTLLSQKHIIILDGNENSRKFLAVQCHNWGMHPKPVKDIEELLPALEQNDHPYDFAIVDNTFLKKEKSDLIQKIRENKIHQNIQIIIMDSQSEKKQSPDDENFPILIKPVQQTQLYELLVSLVPEEEIKAEEAVVPVQEEPVEQAPPVLNLLLAEDNEINQKLIDHIMTRLGYKIDIAIDGSEAVKMAKKKDYDIIFMDLQMPVMDGIEACKKILKRTSGKQPKIIAITANVHKEDKEMCFEAGMVDYIAKPVNITKLQEMLEHWGNLKPQKQD